MVILLPFKPLPDKAGKVCCNSASTESMLSPDCSLHLQIRHVKLAAGQLCPPCCSNSFFQVFSQECLRQNFANQLTLALIRAKLKSYRNYHSLGNANRQVRRISRVLKLPVHFSCLISGATTVCFPDLLVGQQWYAGETA